jgi:uncharacterized OB-fold protein
MTATAAERLPTGPASDGGDTEFWEGLRDGSLRLPRCADCLTWRTPGRPLCAGCRSFATRWEGVAPSGRVYTWIRSHRAFVAELDVPTPYVTVLVELDDAPVRLLGILEQPDTAVRIGLPVTGVIRRPSNAEWPVLRWQAGAVA